MRVYKIKDSYLVLKGQAVLPQERERVKNLTFKGYEAVNGATFDSFDAEKSFLLGAELPRNEYDLCPRDFRNELSHNKEQEAVKKRYPKAVWAYADFMVPDEDIHQGIKNIGTRIENCCEVYHIKYNDSKKTYFLADESGKPCSCSGTRAESDKHGVRMFLEMFAFERADYLRLRQLYVKVRTNPNFVSSLTDKDKSLLYMGIWVKNRIKKAQKQKPYTFRHELVHIRNRYIDNRFDIAPNRGKLSLENRYRLAQYDEKAAHLAENLLAIKKYLKGGKSDDFSMFPDKSAWLVRVLKSVPAAQRRFLCNNNKMLVSGTFANWDRNYADGYGKQLGNVVKSWAKKSPLSYIGSDEAEYLKRRTGYLTLAKVDAFTGEEKPIDFSKYIDQDIVITREIDDGILQSARDELKNRQNKMNQSGITRSMVAQVQQMHKMYNLGGWQKLGRGGR